MPNQPPHAPPHLIVNSARFEGSAHPDTRDGSDDHKGLRPSFLCGIIDVRARSYAYLGIGSSKSVTTVGIRYRGIPDGWTENPSCAASSLAQSFPKGAGIHGTDLHTLSMQGMKLGSTLWTILMAATVTSSASPSWWAIATCALDNAMTIIMIAQKYLVKENTSPY